VLDAPPAQGAISAARRRIEAAVGWLQASPVPAHLTVLFPFLPPDHIGPAHRAQLAEECRTHAPFCFVLDRVVHKDGLLSLEPRPSAALDRLVAGVRGRSPDTPPYRGQYGPAPRLHLTVDYGPSLAALDPSVLQELQATLTAALPLTVPVDQLDLWVATGGRWSRSTCFPLLGGAP
jgi:hypothetical protein